VLGATGLGCQGLEYRCAALGPGSPEESRQVAMLRDARKRLDAVGTRIGYPPGELHLCVFRHTFIAAALQLTDHGAPISSYTVAKWLGRGGTALVNRVYGHLGDVRHRSEQLEYRVQQHAQVLGDRLVALRNPARICPCR
jgi:integrase